jgi:hypothetical protein
MIVRIIGSSGSCITAQSRSPQITSATMTLTIMGEVMRGGDHEPDPERNLDREIAEFIRFAGESIERANARARHYRAWSWVWFLLFVLVALCPLRP